MKTVTALIEHYWEPIVHLSNGDVTCGSTRLAAAEINKPPLLIPKSHKQLVNGTH
jgi:hypothetical protein